ncbi:MAG: hypothetical protein HGA70_05605 [Chlorobiaceae bacterium]|nr:hypothetical protein [Chlorobiaceae bacterium]NTW10773.1 hypothetical protein [Chlorobiaceae bacterium]
MPDIVFIILLPLVIFTVTFPALWIGVSAILSLAGGWSLLAERFTAKQQDPGKEFRFASALLKKQGMFPVTYRGSLFITIGESGVRLSVLFLFRFNSPALFIPWTEIESVTEQRHLFGSYGVIDIRNCPVKILLPGNSGKYLMEIYARIRGLVAPSPAGKT